MTGFTNEQKAALAGAVESALDPTLVPRLRARIADLEAALRNARIYIANFLEAAQEDGSSPGVKRRIQSDLDAIDALLEVPE